LALLAIGVPSPSPMFDFDSLDVAVPARGQRAGTRAVAARSVERVWAVSDIHTDAKENLEFMERLDSQAYAADALIVAGDISDDLAVVRRTLRGLRAKFARVFFVPGNHDLWVARQHNVDGCIDSLQKLRALERICTEEGVDTRPQRLLAANGAGVSDLWILPVISWHCRSFDEEPDLDSRWQGIPRAEHVCSDYRLCKWPKSLDQTTDSVAVHLDKMNDDWIQDLEEPEFSRLSSLAAGCREPGSAVITFSHFLPRIELLPEKRYLYFPVLAQFVGSPPLGRRLKRLRPDVHVFGHTHFGWDQEIDGVRYLSPPVGMPRERDKRVSTVSTGDFLQATEHTNMPVRPVLIWDSAKGFAERYDAGWSGFYRKYEREPKQVTVLPDYVASMYQWDEEKHGPKSKVIGWEGKTPAWKFGPAWSQSRKTHY